MTPLIRFHSIILTITSITLFFIWKMLLELKELDPFFAFILIGATSIGFYRLFLTGIQYLLSKCRYLKKIVFGAYYVEGVWVGFFIGKEGKVRFYVETYEQDFDSITIRGRGFREAEGYFGTWVSDSVAFDVIKGTITYTYQSDAISNTFSNPGFAVFNVEREKNNAPPHRLVGFSADLYSPTKMKSFEEKINDKPSIGDLEVAIDKAKTLFEKHKYICSFSDE